MASDSVNVRDLIVKAKAAMDSVKVEELVEKAKAAGDPAELTVSLDAIKAAYQAERNLRIDTEKVETSTLPGLEPVDGLEHTCTGRYRGDLDLHVHRLTPSSVLAGRL
ncbi:OLC1v1002519C1 [Oldenlandia corymbosa var. corymbosa]|uniref:OLC1v1002519C1 n=1 Tax=Oldenlandia corymbosa var. corymbosa TaxID=529605 RepID=A0AAV1D7T4_OLDCO|nr:OLC1v1002519C1 [Oldenlandia corymbosa var. corymbosa]